MKIAAYFILIFLNLSSSALAGMPVRCDFHLRIDKLIDKKPSLIQGVTDVAPTPDRPTKTMPGYIAELQATVLDAAPADPDGQRGAMIPPMSEQKKQMVIQHWSAACNEQKAKIISVKYQSIQGADIPPADQITVGETLVTSCELPPTKSIHFLCGVFSFTY